METDNEDADLFAEQMQDVTPWYRLAPVRARVGKAPAKPYSGVAQLNNLPKILSARIF
ncbi:MAG: hypothetical protein CM15mP120_26920 [Pseudomonadota bacterium]|nr:MAG: hypothetical protein CM15mP120_26920 [Pseudomonadota bacterium]